MQDRIMFVQPHGGLGSCCGYISKVKFSKTGKTIYFDDKSLQTLSGSGYKANYIDIETKIKYWVSGPKKNGNDLLYKGTIYVDDDVNEEYWITIRDRPDMVGIKEFKTLGKYSKSGKRDARPKGILSAKI